MYADLCAITVVYLSKVRRHTCLQPKDCFVRTPDLRSSMSLLELPH